MVARFGGDTNPDTRTRVALALTDKGVASGVLDRHEEAIVVYDEVVARFGDDTNPDTHTAVVAARRTLDPFRSPHQRSG